MVGKDKLVDLDDETLWILLLKGNMMTLELLYRRYYDLLLNYGLKFCQDKELVKDCIQDLFVKLHQSRNLSGTDHVRTYLLRSIKNLLMDKLSSIKLMEDIDEIGFDLKIDDSELAFLFHKNDDDLRLSRQLLNAYRQLPENQREAIYLRYVKGFSYREIAEVLAIAPQSGMNLVSRGLSKLRMIMHMKNIFLFLFFVLVL